MIFFVSLPATKETEKTKCKNQDSATDIITNLQKHLVNMESQQLSGIALGYGLGDHGFEFQ
jgi:hypothetical protein